MSLYYDFMAVLWCTLIVLFPGNPETIECQLIVTRDKTPWIINK